MPEEDELGRLYDFTFFPRPLLRYFVLASLANYGLFPSSHLSPAKGRTPYSFSSSPSSFLLYRAPHRRGLAWRFDPEEWVTCGQHHPRIFALPFAGWLLLRSVLAGFAVHYQGNFLFFLCSSCAALRCVKASLIPPIFFFFFSFCRRLLFRSARKDRDGDSQQ
jgi:hypothetical protein